MAQVAKFDELIVNGIRELSKREKEEVLNFYRIYKSKGR